MPRSLWPNAKRSASSPCAPGRFDFSEAVQRVAQTNPREVAEVEASGEVDSIDALIDRFEAAGYDNGERDKCWHARDLQSLLGYAKWDKFESVIERAEQACRNAGHPVGEHFIEVFPQSGKNPLGGRPGKDFELSRYACYLIAQNASSRLKPVAFAQTYFAIQTRRQDRSPSIPVPLAIASISSSHVREPGPIK
jgi:DNA-damage-inducible protein D